MDYYLIKFRIHNKTHLEEDWRLVKAISYDQAIDFMEEELEKSNLQGMGWENKTILPDEFRGL